MLTRQHRESHSCWPNEVFLFSCGMNCAAVVAAAAVVVVCVVGVDKRDLGVFGSLGMCRKTRTQ